MKIIKTTHVSGVLLDNMGNPMKEAQITVEKTDKDMSYTGLRTTIKTSIEGRYNFRLIEGFYKIFITPADKQTEIELGIAHVASRDYDTQYTIEELLDK